MIRHSFIFLPSCTPLREQKLWAAGIKDWATFRKLPKIKGINPERKILYDTSLKVADEALQQGNSSYFVGKMPLIHAWRFYDYFRDQTCFVDIETDANKVVTVVGISNYYHTNQFVKGMNLTRDALRRELAPYKLIITFNGAAFDLPILRKEYGLELAIPHIDLKPLCAQFKLMGGLKEVERILNLKRPTHLYGNPIDLWKAFHASRDKEYLDLLLHYNAEDIENLKGIMEHIWKLKKEQMQKLLA
ncbi:ribonuclease H-like domain-containing protein [Candidatus Woesearchaeota archaeon]|nr:ribonuclease H-like domain-containing protein [Candidatus Woesearchaeota archaeon]